jgi:hypothetical protein
MTIIVAAFTQADERFRIQTMLRKLKDRKAVVNFVRTPDDTFAEAIVT